MSFIPFKRLTIHTQLRAEKVLQNLEGIVELYPAPASQAQNRPRGYRFHVLPNRNSTQSQEQRPYYGKIEGYHFKIHRNVSAYRRGPSPMIEGDIQPGARGCSICMTVHPHTMETAAFGCVLGIPACIVFASGVTAVVETIRFGEQASYSLSSFGELFLGSTLWLIYSCALFWGGIKAESAQTRSFFCPLFQADRVDEFGTVDLIKRWLRGDGDSSLEGR